MLKWSYAGYEDVIDISETEVQSSGHFINESLKCLGGIPQTEGRSNIFEESEWGGESRFRNVGGRYRDLVVGLY